MATATITTKQKLIKEKKKLDKEKARLNEQLQLIEQAEQKEYQKKKKDFLSLIKPELDAYIKTRKFRAKGAVKVELNYDLDVELYDESWDNCEDLRSAAYGDEYDCSIDCDVRPKEPKGFNITQFINEGYCDDSLEEMRRIHPELNAHLVKRRKARSLLVKKAVSSAKKIGITEETALHILSGIRIPDAALAARGRRHRRPRPGPPGQAAWRARLALI